MKTYGKPCSCNPGEKPPPYGGTLWCDYCHGSGWVDTNIPVEDDLGGLGQDEAA